MILYKNTWRHVDNIHSFFEGRITCFTFRRFNEELYFVLTVQAIIKITDKLCWWDTFFHFSSFACRFQTPTAPVLFWLEFGFFILLLICTITLNLAVLSDTDNFIKKKFTLLCIIIPCVCILVARTIIMKYIPYMCRTEQ